jgi:transcription antitermination factor NusG
MSNAQVQNYRASTTPHIFGSPGEHYWFAIYTRARHEKMVTNQLSHNGVTTFLPLLSQTHRWSDRKKAVQMPLFPGYTFVRTAWTSAAHLEVLKTAGVVGFVGTGRVGIPIPDKQIEDIQTVLQHGVSCAVYPFLRVGQLIRVRGGCLDGVKGRLVTLRGQRSLIISVESVHNSLAISLEGFDIEILPANNSVT